MAKCLVIFPPQWSPLSPHLAPASMVGNIRANGHYCDIKDLNVEYYDEILKSDYLKKILIKLFNDFISLSNDLKQSSELQKKEGEHSIEFQIKAKKMLRINDLKENRTNETKQVLAYVEEAVKILKNENTFYDLKLIVNSFKIIDMALNIVSLNEYPQEFSMHNLINQSVIFNYENILKYCNSNNMFKEFYARKADEIADREYDYIGISVSSSTQLLSALTLSKILKDKVSANTKICLGGNYISRITEAIKKVPEFFKVFCDFVIYEEGERATKELLEALGGKRNIEDVSSLIYLDKEDNVKRNDKKRPTMLSELAMPNLDGFPLDKYLLYTLIMPIQSSRGCYWKKCTFCDHDFGQTYNIKEVSNLVNEIKTLKEKYGINNFEFTDEAMTPGYMKLLSKKLIEENVKINWFCDLRLESAFTKEIFDLAYKAGLRLILWGFESGNKRIMDLINKGVDVEDRYNVLRRSSNAGIFNFAYVFTGFPTETYEEAMDTVNAVCNNTDIIHAFGKSVFTMGKHSIINSHPERFGVIKLDDIEDFSSDAKYEITNGLTKKELDEVNNIFSKKAYESYKNPAWMHLTHREVLFLYVCKFGAQVLREMKYC